MNNPTIISYSRVSSVRQAQGNKTGLAQQQDDDVLNEISLRYNMPIDSRRFVDAGVSAYSASHMEKSFGRLLRFIDDGSIAKDSILVISSLDRISRMMVNKAMELMLSILNRGIKIYTTIDSKLYEPNSPNLSADLIVSIIYLERSHNESETKSKRIKSANQKRVEQFLNGERNPDGLPYVIPAGGNPFWTTIVEDAQGNKVIAPNEYIEVAEKVCSMFKDGLGFSKVCDYLKANYPERKWTGISEIFRNDALCGTRDMKVGSTKYKLENYYPSIISYEELLHLRKLRANKKVKPAHAQRISLMGGLGLLVCGECGELITSSSYFRSDTGKLRANYSCRGKKVKRNNCTMQNFEVYKLDKEILLQGKKHAWKSLISDNIVSTKDKNALLHEVETLESNISESLQAFEGLSIPRAVAIQMSKDEETLLEKKELLKSYKVDVPEKMPDDIKEVWNSLMSRWSKDKLKMQDNEMRLQLRDLLIKSIKSIKANRDYNLEVVWKQ